MNSLQPLHVVHLTLDARTAISADLRAVRLAHECVHSDIPVLFLCDLPDAPSQMMPQDAALIRFVQSGVMSISARRPGQYFFLVRNRKRDEMMHMWLGKNQAEQTKDVIHSLLQGTCTASFAASNLSPSAFKDAFNAVLITESHLRFMPDTPAAMFHRLTSTGCSALLGEICMPKRPDEAIFIRLLRAGFTLTPETSSGIQQEPLAAVYSREALCCPFPEKTAQGCTFVLATPPTLSDLLSHARVMTPRSPSPTACLPAVQALFLLFCAALGWGNAAVLLIVLPELQALRRPRRLAGALVRLSLLPQRAVIAINARIAAHRRAKRLHISFADHSGVCTIFGAALLFLSFYGTTAMIPLFPVSLLWLCAPLITRSLTLPARERIPLNPDEQALLRQLAQKSFDSLVPEQADPAHLLAACAGCMMGLLEADEAARRAEAMLPSLSPASAFDAACLMAGMQFFQERMAECDAALRPLPAALHASALAFDPSCEKGRLAALLCIAQSHPSTENALEQLRRVKNGPLMDNLFLRREDAIPCDLLLPLTHPHTFLKRHSTHAPSEKIAQKNDSPPLNGDVNRFLVLACAALDFPFHALLMRSSPIEPYAPLLDLL